MARPLSLWSVAELRKHFLDADTPATDGERDELAHDSRNGVRQLHTQLCRRAERARIEALRIEAMLATECQLWRSGQTRIAGVDEAGTGPLAGPVVAAAVIFPPDTRLPGINDSKQLSATQREQAEQHIRRAATAIGIGVAEVEEIDRINIYQAALAAMQRAVAALAVPAEHVLVDARTIPGITAPQEAFIKGDSRVFSIAAASIIAKTHRDRIMLALDATWPAYGFAQHKGYGTAEHQSALHRVGPCPAHRRSFGIVRDLCREA